MTTPSSISDRDYRETANSLRRQAIARLNYDFAPPDPIKAQPEETRHSAQEQENEHSDKKLLKYFFVFSLVLSSLLALVVPSAATIGIVLSVIGLGAPLFSANPKGKRKLPSNNTAYGSDVSKQWLLFVAFITLVMPFIFGWRLGKEPAIFFILAFLGLVVGVVVLAVVKLSSHSKY